MQRRVLARDHELIPTSSEMYQIFLIVKCFCLKMQHVSLKCTGMMDHGLAQKRRIW